MTPTTHPYPAYKPSGVPWLGDMPEHWEMLPGKACYLVKQVPNKGLQEKTVLSLSYGKIKIRPEETLHGLVPASFETYQIVEPNDVICRPTDLQNDWNSLRFGLSQQRGIITSAYMCLRTRPQLASDYGYLLLHTYDLKKVFYGLGSGLRQNLGWTDFKPLPCLVPPLAEQAAIVRYLDHADRRVRRYLSAKQKLIALLQEEKQAIISQAVTRGLDPNVPLKPSGVPWLGDVPEHWGVAAAKTRYAIQLGKMLQNAPNNGYEIEVPYLKAQHVQWFRVLTADISTMWASYAEISKFGVKPGDLLVCEGGEGGRTALLHEPIGVCIIQNALHRVRPHEQDLNTFLQYVMSAVALSGWFDALNNKATIAHFTREKFSALMIPIPPLAEQAAIVDYLDKATAGIDAAIGRARRQIELLREYRTRLIADVVTGKLDVRAAAAQLPEQPDDQEPMDEGDPTEDMDGDLEEADDAADEAVV